MPDKILLRKIQTTIVDFIRENSPPALAYHNHEHALDVMQAVVEIGKEEKLSETDLLLLETAAAFHDAGYLQGQQNHEENSCKLATRILKENKIDEEYISQICNLIIATKVPHHPKNKLQEVICDADLDYLGRDDFFQLSTKVCTEFKNTGIIKEDKDWYTLEIKFLESHRYFTSTSIKKREQKKQEHIKVLKDKFNSRG